MCILFMNGLNAERQSSPFCRGCCQCVVLIVFLNSLRTVVSDARVLCVTHTAGGCNSDPSRASAALIVSMAVWMVLVWNREKRKLVECGASIS